jgi:hypothetical protein
MVINGENFTELKKNYSHHSNNSRIMYLMFFYRVGFLRACLVLFFFYFFIIGLPMTQFLSLARTHTYIQKKNEEKKPRQRKKGRKTYISIREKNERDDDND